MVTILGLGFTGRRLARRLLSRGIPTFAAVRGDFGRFGALAAQGLRLIEWPRAAELPRGARILHSIPSVTPAETEALHATIQALEPVRVVYISSTSVYGARQEVDENTPALPHEPKGEQRLAEEEWVAAGPWTSLILRAAAIYGPGRGVHTAVREGRAPRSSGVTSRLHVDDLAALADVALFSDLQGAWPVADDLPCSSAEIIAALDAGQEVLRQFSVAGRRVNGSAIRQLLGVNLLYPSWKTGLPAAIKEEERMKEA